MRMKYHHRLNLLDYLENPDNDWPNREEMATVLEIKRQTLYQHFTAQELGEIEYEGLERRRKRYVAALAKVDDSVLKEASAGDMVAARLAYQRFENWSEKKSLELSGNVIIKTDSDDDKL